VDVVDEVEVEDFDSLLEEIVFPCDPELPDPVEEELLTEELFTWD
jgi:hypothetical protein